MIFIHRAAVDLHNKCLDVSTPPPPSNFLHFHAVCREKWRSNRLAPPHLGNPRSTLARRPGIGLQTIFHPQNCFKTVSKIGRLQSRIVKWSFGSQNIERHQSFFFLFEVEVEFVKLLKN